MSAASPTLLVVTGLQREAQIAAGANVRTVCSGGNPTLLRERLAAFSHAARSREIRNPKTEEQNITSARMSGGVGSISGILSFGLAGGLAPHLQSGDVVIASHVITADQCHETDPGWQAFAVSSLANTWRIHRGTIAGHIAVLTEPTDKAALHTSTGALAVDMESHIAAVYAREHGLAFAAIRVIGDPVSRRLPQIAATALKPDGRVDVAKVLVGVMRSPGQLPALIAAGIDSERAFARLRRVRSRLGPLFGLRTANF